MRENNTQVHVTYIDTVISCRLFYKGLIALFILQVILTLAGPPVLGKPCDMSNIWFLENGQRSALILTLKANADEGHNKNPGIKP
jgi:hypothetical protein